jgi:hypothetical protein
VTCGWWQAMWLVVHITAGYDKKNPVVRNASLTVAG